MIQWDLDLNAEKSDDLVKKVPGWDLRTDCTCDPYFNVYSSTGTFIINISCVLMHVKDYKEP